MMKYIQGISFKVWYCPLIMIEIPFVNGECTISQKHVFYYKKNLKQIFDSKIIDISKGCKMKNFI